MEGQVDHSGSGYPDNWEVVVTIPQPVLDNGVADNWNVFMENAPLLDTGLAEEWWLGFEGYENDAKPVEDSQPFVPADELVTNSLIPLLILFAPAVVLLEFGLMGFLLGLNLGTYIAYTAGFLPVYGLPLVLLVSATIYLKGGS